MKRKSAFRLCAALLAVAVTVTLILVLRQMMKRSGGTEDGASPGRTVEEMLGLGQDEGVPVYDKGKKYTLNPNLESFLLMGIDHEGEVDEAEYSDGGRCDVLLVMVMDRTRERVTVLQLDRDTMTDINVLDEDGSVVMTRELQLEFAHYYGSGMEDSCVNTVNAVSNLLYGVEINGYAALQMDVIPALNDLIGGVTVTIEDDFSLLDPELVMGETVTLLGEHAMHYVHDRRYVGDGSNTSRMRRHRTYFSAFAEKLESLMEEDAAIAAELYQAAKPYMVTDMGSGTVVNLLNEARGYVSMGVVTLDGENIVNEEDNLMEFHVDDDSVRETVLNLFYLDAEEEDGE